MSLKDRKIKGLLWIRKDKDEYETTCIHVHVGLDGFGYACERPDGW